MLITNLCIDSIAIFLLFQLLCFHLFIAFRGQTTYEFITNHKVVPIAPKPHTQNMRMSTIEGANLRSEIERSSSSVQAGPTEGVRLMEPLESSRNYGHTGEGSSSIKHKSESEAAGSIHILDEQITQRMQYQPKELIIKHKSRRSKTEQNKSLAAVFDALDRNR